VLWTTRAFESTLDRVNAINDSLKKKKAFESTSPPELDKASHQGAHIPGGREGSPETMDEGDGGVGDASCVCDGWTPQNSAHLYRCPWVGDGVGRSREQAREDEKWCEAVARFVS